MASKTEVKKYLAYWFQLGKKIVINNGAASLQPGKVIDGENYSNEFEECWKEVLSFKSGECYLEGTQQQLLNYFHLSGIWLLARVAICQYLRRI